jgi:hypothetical protein
MEGLFTKVIVDYDEMFRYVLPVPDGVAAQCALSFRCVVVEDLQVDLGVFCA